MALIIPVHVPQMEYQELLCQAHSALTKVTKCYESYKLLISNLKSLHENKVSRERCSAAPPHLCCALQPHDACAPTLREPRG